MYGLVRKLFTLALIQGFTCGVFAGGNPAVETSGTTQEVSAESDRLSPPWLEQFSTGTPGCTLGSGSYTWRRCGLGSNLNSEYFGVMLVATLNISNAAILVQLCRTPTVDLIQCTLPLLN